MNDPLYHDEDLQRRMVDDPQVMVKFAGLQWVKLATGLAALALICAIWLVWRFG